jgi:hypothetical protein
LKCPYYHGDTFYYAISGKQTAKTSPLLTERFNESKRINYSYLQKKWGINNMTCDFEEYRDIEPYTSPHDLLHIDKKINEEITKKRKLVADNYHLLGSSSFNLEFARSKHLDEFLKDQPHP